MSSFAATRGVVIFALLMAAVFTVQSVMAEEKGNAQGSGLNIITSVPRNMTYQGILKDANGDPIPETVVNIRFRIYNVPTGGIELLTRDIQDTTDTGGHFTAELENINLPFDEDYWLELRVNGEYLTPRQKLNMSAYSARADTADYAFDAPGAMSYWHIEDSVLTTDDLWGITRGNADNVNWGNDAWSVVNLGVACTTGVSGEDYWYPTIGGGWQNEAWLYCTVAGGIGNKARMFSTAICGGENNLADGQYASICGGEENNAGSNYASITGGYQNSAGFFSFVGGGGSNTAENYGVVCGGWGNTADGSGCSVLNGTGNIVSAENCTILGGDNNRITANGDYALVFGEDIYANSTAPRCYFFNGTYDGRVGINRDDNDGGISHPIHVGTDGLNGNGARLTIGGTWTNGSSRDFKENFKSLEPNELIAKINTIEVASWNYKGSEERHIGPVSEDFVAAFDVGTIRESDGRRDNQYLAASDVAGVALAGVKELLRENRELKDIISDLENRITELENR